MGHRQRAAAIDALAMRAHSLLPTALLALAGCAVQQPAEPQYAVFLLAGQSNMSGRGLGPDPMAATQPDPRVLMWDGAAIRAAREPLPHLDLGQRPIAAGPGLSFAQAWLARFGRPGQRIVLVPAAFGGTGYSDKDGSWRVTGATPSHLAAQAAARANAALAALGPGARLAGILWHQGETDGANRMQPDAYKAELLALAGYLRATIRGAGQHTPYIVGQYVPAHTRATPALAALAAVNRDLPAALPNSGCVPSLGLHGNTAPDGIHFDAASQRELGVRYAAALAALADGRGAAPCDW